MLSISADIKWCTSGVNSISGGGGGLSDNAGNEGSMRGAVGNLFKVNTDYDSNNLSPVRICMYRIHFFSESPLFSVVIVPYTFTNKEACFS